MKPIFLLLCLFGAATAVKAQETQRNKLPPVRTTDNVRPAPRQDAVVPVLKGGSMQTAKTGLPAQAVPIRTSNITGNGLPAPAVLKAADGRASGALQPPSALSAKQAQELLKRDSTKH